MVLVCATVSATGAARFEVPANRKAAGILHAELLEGPNYRVRETVVSYGYMHHWTVDSDFGTSEVTGDGALRALIREIYAIAALKEISQGEAFLSSVAYAAKQPFQFAGKMVEWTSGHRQPAKIALFGRLTRNAFPTTAQFG